MTEFMVLIEPWGVYVKEKEFFRSQGGFTSVWGRRWVLVLAESIENAREIGIRRRDSKEKLR